MFLFIALAGLAALAYEFATMKPAPFTRAEAIDTITKLRANQAIVVREGIDPASINAVGVGTVLPAGTGVPGPTVLAFDEIMSAQTLPVDIWASRNVASGLGALIITRIGEQPTITDFHGPLSLLVSSKDPILLPPEF